MVKGVLLVVLFSAPRVLSLSGNVCFPLSMSDSVSDGWDGAEYTISEPFSGVVKATGTMSSGVATEEVTICVDYPGCYEFAVTEGSFPGEISFSLGAGSELSGGAPFGPAGFDLLIDGSIQVANCSSQAPTMTPAPSLTPSPTSCFETDLILRDSWGDGWNGGEYNVTQGNAVIACGTMLDGTEETVKLCLEFGCYELEVTAGEFPEEQSFELLGILDSNVVPFGPEQFSIGPNSCTPAPTTECDDVDLVLSDAWGDGWNGGTYEITSNDGADVVAQGTLEDGSEGTVRLCLLMGCYEMEMTAGDFPSEQSFEILRGEDVLLSGSTAPFGPEEFDVGGGCTLLTPTPTPGIATSSSPTPLGPTPPPSLEPTRSPTDAASRSPTSSIDTFDALAEAVSSTESVGTLPDDTVFLFSETLTVISRRVEIVGSGGTTFDGDSVISLFFVSDNGHLSLTRITLRNGHGSGTTSGAATVFFSSSLTAFSCRFENNTNAGSFSGGGAIRLEANSTFTAIDSHFVGNKAEGDAGVVIVFDGTFSATNSNFASNVGASGGVAHLDNSAMNATNCVFDSNVANFSSGASGLGGVVSAISTTLCWTECTFTHNDARTGGVVHATSGSVLKANSCSFTSNHADFQAGVYSLTASTALVDACQHEGNQVGPEEILSRGGVAVARSGSIVEASSTNFVDNSAVGSLATAGAILVTMNSSADLSSCAVNGNSATVEGGAVVVEAGSGSGDNPSSMTARRSEFLNNTALCAAAIHVDFKSVLIMDESKLLDNRWVNGSDAPLNCETASVVTCDLAGSLFTSKMTIGPSQFFVLQPTCIHFSYLANDNLTTTPDAIVAGGDEDATRILTPWSYPCAPGKYSTDGLEHGDESVYVDRNGLTIDDVDPSFCQGLTSSGNTCPDSCEVCPSGRFSTFTLDRYALVSVDSCEDCPVGTALFDAGTNASLHDDPDDCGVSLTCEALPSAYNASLVRIVRASSKDSRRITGKYAPLPGSIFCTVAEPGFFVNKTEATESIPCSPGTFSVGGESAVNCTECAPGRFQPDFAQTSCLISRPGFAVKNESATFETECSPGKVASGSGATSCTSCPVRQYQTDSGQFSCILADAGSFVDIEGATEQLPCPPGTFSGSAESECKKCEPGRYAAASGSTSCVLADAGSFVESEGASKQELCPPGKISGFAASECTRCSAGTFASESGSTVCQLADAGSIVDSDGSSEQTQCDAGSFSGVAASECTQCSPGSFQPDRGKSVCLLASAGSFTDTAGATKAEQCMPGRFSAGEGATSCDLCASGSAQPKSGQTSCVLAAAGSFAKSEGETETEPCQPGRFSAGEGASSCEACTPGSAQPEAGQVSCVVAAAGTFVPDTGSTEPVLCPAGRFSAGEGAVSCESCPAGSSQSSVGQSSCILAAAGSFVDSKGRTKSEKCPAGRFSAGEGATSCESCSAGSVQPNSGQTSCVLAAAGTFVPDTGSTEPVLCPAGRFSAGEGAVSCESCPAGSSQSSVGQSSCILAAAGSFVDSTGRTKSEKCPAGRFSAGEGATSCESCSAGSVQPNSGQTSCVLAAAGTFVPDAGSTAPVLCPAGRFSAGEGAVSCESCPAGSSQSSAGQSSCILAAAGSFVDSKGRTKSEKCSAGRFSAGEGATSCESCSTGSAQPKSGQTSCVLAAAGTFVEDDGAKETERCPSGSFSAGEGATRCELCSPGSSQSRTGQASCVLAAAGRFVDGEGATESEECPAGRFSAGEGATSCEFCSPGSVQPDSGQTSCVLSAAGSFVDDEGATESKECPAGRFSAGEGATSCESCSPGSVQPDNGQISCVLSAAGSFVDDEGATESKECPAGRFSAGEGATSCESCSPGSVQPDAGQTSCVLSAAGSFVEGAGEKKSEPCPAGRFSAGEGATSCEACSPGSIQPDARQTSCLLSAAGSFVDFTGAIAASLCAPGRFSAGEGASSCEICARGTAQPASGSASCILAAPGSFVDAEGATEAELCPPGRFSAGEGSTSCELCSPGSAQSDVGQTSCVLSAAGSFVEDSGATETSLCPIGRFSAGQGATSCVECGLDGVIGEYSSRLGQQACTISDAGSFVDRAGASEQLPCDPGRFSGAGATSCTLCAEGTYSAEPGSAVCSLSEAGTYVPEVGSSSSLLCPAGRFSGAAQSFCELCAEGTTSAEGSASCTSAAAGEIATSGPVAELEFESVLLLANVEVSDIDATFKDAFASALAETLSDFSDVVQLPLVVTFTSAQSLLTSRRRRLEDVSAAVAVSFATATNFSSAPSEDVAQSSQQLNSDFAEDLKSDVSNGHIQNELRNRSEAFAMVVVVDSDESIDLIDTNTTVSTSSLLGGSQNQTSECPPGKFSSAGASVCTDCDPGSFSSESGSTSCTLASSGNFVADPGSSEEIPCPPGRSSGNAEIECKRLCCCVALIFDSGSNCSIGTFATSAGQSECEFCPIPLTTTGEGSLYCDVRINFANSYTTRLAQACRRGFYWDPLYFEESGRPGLDLDPPEQCIDCCVDCDDACENGVDDCTDCNRDGIVLNSLPVKRGFWRADQLANKVYECDVRRGCKGGNSTNPFDQCFRSNTGALCGACRHEWYMERPRLTCTECGPLLEIVVTIGGIIALTVLIIFLIFVVVCCRSRTRWTLATNLIHKIVRDAAKTDASTAVIDSLENTISGEEKVAAATEETDDAAIRRRIIYKSMLTKLKIVIAAWQIASSTVYVLPQVDFPDVFGLLLTATNALGLDIMRFTSVECLVNWSYFSKLLFMTLFPFCLAVVVGVAYFVKRKCQGRLETENDRKIAMNRAVYATLLLFYVTLPGASSFTFLYFSCLRFDNGPEKDLFYMAADLTIQCKDRRRYRRWAGVVSIMIVIWPVGIPLSIGVLLWRFRRRLNPPLPAGNSPASNPTFTHDSFRRERVRHERAMQQIQKLDIRNRDKGLSSLEFVYEEYEPRCYMFPVFELVRRVFLTSILTVFQSGQMGQVVVGLLGALLSYAVYDYYQPYIADDDDMVSTVAQGQLVLIYFAAVAVYTSENLEKREGVFSSDAFGIVIVIIFVASFVVAVWVILLEIFGKDEIVTAAVSLRGKLRGSSTRNSSSSSSAVGGGGDDDDDGDDSWSTGAVDIHGEEGGDDGEEKKRVLPPSSASPSQTTTTVINVGEEESDDDSLMV